MNEVDLLYEELHKDYEYRKAEITTKLVSIRDSKISNAVMKIWINQAIEFIKEREV
jgi:primosomal protein N''